MKTFELLRNVLLVSLLAMLTYVLYKRMLHVMRKQHVQEKFPALPNALHWTDSGQGQIALKLNMKMHLDIQIFNTENASVLTLANDEFPKGDHIFTFEKNQLSAGKYYYKIVSPHEQASQYFNI
jgi:hypothetical protein